MKDIIVKEPNVFATAKFDENFKLNELRIFEYIISQIDNDINEVIVSPNFLIKLFKLKSNTFYDTMKLISKKIIEKTLLIEEGKSFKAFPIYAYCKYNDETKQYLIKLSEELRPYLQGKRGEYFKYYISNIVELKSKNMINIYRYLCKTLPANKNEFELKISVELFKKNLNIEKYYKEFKMLKGFLLNKAKKEITEKTDLNFDFETLRDEKDKRKIKYLLLKIKRKNNENKILEKINTSEEIEKLEELEKLKRKEKKEKWKKYLMLDKEHKKELKNQAIENIEKAHNIKYEPNSDNAIYFFSQTHISDQICKLI